MEVSSAEFAYRCRIADYTRALMRADSDAQRLHLLNLLAQENRQARERGFSALIGDAPALAWCAAEPVADAGLSGSSLPG